MDYEHFWKYHNKSNIDIHAVRLIEKQNERIIELEAQVQKLEDGLILIRKSTEIMEARRFAEQALKS